VDERGFRSAKETRAGVGFAQVQMQNELGMQGALWFSTVDERGHWLDTPAFEQNLFSRWKIQGGFEPTTYRVQVLTTSYGKLSEQDHDEVTQFFEAARAALWQQLSAQIRHPQ